MNAMKMDAKRSICSVKMIIIIVALVFTLIFSSWDMIRASKKDILAYGVIDMLGTALMMDKFKVLMVMFTAGIYTAGFCYDFKHHYIRMILARTDLISYSISKFIVNTVAVVFACIASFYLFFRCVVHHNIIYLVLQLYHWSKLLQERTRHKKTPNRIGIYCVCYLNLSTFTIYTFVKASL